MVVWANTDAPSEAQIEQMLDKYYSISRSEANRDETEEIINRIMDEVIEVYTTATNRRERVSIGECINRIYTETADEDNEQSRPLDYPEIVAHKMAIAHCGIRVVDKVNVAIANDHHYIKRITGLDNGYNKLFRRHLGFLELSRQVGFPGNKNRRCSVFAGLIKKMEADMTDEERLGRLL